MALLATRGDAIISTLAQLILMIRSMLLVLILLPVDISATTINKAILVLFRDIIIVDVPLFLSTTAFMITLLSLLLLSAPPQATR